MLQPGPPRGLSTEQRSVSAGSHPAVRYVISDSIFVQKTFKPWHEQALDLSRRSKVISCGLLFPATKFRTGLSAHQSQPYVELTCATRDRGTYETSSSTTVVYMHRISSTTLTVTLCLLSGYCTHWRQYVRWKHSITTSTTIASVWNATSRFESVHL